MLARYDWVVSSASLCLTHLEVEVCNVDAVAGDLAEDRSVCQVSRIDAARYEQNSSVKAITVDFPQPDAPTSASQIRRS